MRGRCRGSLCPTALMSPLIGTQASQPQCGGRPLWERSVPLDWEMTRPLLERARGQLKLAILMRVLQLLTAVMASPAQLWGVLPRNRRMGRLYFVPAERASVSLLLIALMMVATELRFASPSTCALEVCAGLADSDQRTAECPVQWAHAKQAVWLGAADIKDASAKRRGALGRVDSEAAH